MAKKNKTEDASPEDVFNIEDFQEQAAKSQSSLAKQSQDRLKRIQELQKELRELMGTQVKFSGKKYTVRVKATRMGFDGLRRRREGEIFDLTLPVEVPLPTWV